jgi:hypothetical protein
MLGFEQDLRRMLASGLAYLRFVREPESRMEEHKVRTRVVAVTDALDRFARVAGNPVAPEAQQVRRQVALAFNGLTHEPPVVVLHESIGDLVDDALGPKHPLAEPVFRDPSLMRLRGAHQRWAEAYRASLGVVIGRDINTELAAERELLKAEAEFRKLALKTLRRIPKLRLPNTHVNELKQFIGGEARLQFRIWGLQQDLKNNAKEIRLRSEARRFAREGLRSSWLHPSLGVGQRLGIGVAAGGYGLGLLTAAGAYYKKDNSAFRASVGLVGMSLVPDAFHYLASASERGGRYRLARRLSTVGRFSGYGVGSGLFFLSSLYAGEAIYEAEKAQAEVKRLEQAQAQGAEAERRARLAAARIRAEEAQTEKAFARFNERAALAATVMALGTFWGSVGVGAAALAVNGFDVAAQYLGAKETHARVAHLIDKHFNDNIPAPADLAHQGARYLSPAVARWLDRNLDGPDTAAADPPLPNKQFALSADSATPRPVPGNPVGNGEPRALLNQDTTLAGSAKVAV